MTSEAEYVAWSKEKAENLPLFLRPWWLDAVAPERWAVALYKNKENQIKGAMPYFTYSKWGLKVIGMPFLTPYMGLYLHPPEHQKISTAYEWEKVTVSQLIEQIPASPYLQQKFYPEFTYGLPFFWRGYRLDWRYTYHLSLQQTEDEIWQNMEGSARTQLLKTMKLVRVETSDDTATMYKLTSLTFGKQGLKVPYSYAEFQRLFEATQKHNAGTIYLAYLIATGEPVAGMFMAKDHQKVYNLVLGRNHMLDPGGSIHGILWKCIQDHIGHQALFDFEGSMLEGPERMFRSFGSLRIPILQITRYQNRIWKSLFALVGR
jgi:hypothetical protein